jgi:hypothetical protein
VNTPIAHPLAISLNGSDNVGKTAQLAWLDRGVPGAHHVGSVSLWDDRWSQVAGPGFSRWWFEDSTTEEHTGLMVTSHVARRASSGPLALEDRGLPMILATCAATASIKEGLSPAVSLDKVTAIAAGLPQPETRHEIHVLLRRHDDPLQEARAALTREADPVSNRYAAYQEALATVVALQADCGTYDIVLQLGDLPILDVQRLIRRHLADVGVPATPLPDAPVEHLWVLGGMSESGKSTVGGLLRDEHGVTRLEGDVRETLPQYLEDNPHTVVALAYFDLDLYEPTRAALEKIRPYLTKGSVVAFDELAHAKWPGETSALRDTLGTDACRLRLLPGHATPAYLIWEG